jgi:hypothetical protein
MGAKLFYADRLTEMRELIVAFRNFAKAPKTCKVMVWWMIRDELGSRWKGAAAARSITCPVTYQW